MSLSYFAENNSGNEQLWITDGTVAGTRVVKVFAGASISGLTMIGARVYFAVDDGVHGPELWASDGTSAGTFLVQDINPGSAGSSPQRLIDVNGELFFAAGDPTHGVEPWKSDGTSAGTMLIKDIAPGVNSAFFGIPYTNVNGTVFFDASDVTNGVELWKSDGTAAGTVMVKDINPGATASFPQDFINVDGTLFFAATDVQHGTELWSSDGTSAGTQMVKDINAGGIGAFNAGVSLANVNGTLFFNADDGIDGFELWKSDGTAAGTVMVANINPGAASSSPNSLTNVNGTLFFFADDGTHGQELWKSDGTAAGTTLVKDINPGGGSVLTVPGNTININGTLFFDADDGINGPQLWKSDGTTAGTTLIKIITPGGSAPQQFTNVNGALEFYAFDGTSEGLFRSDGTTAGTIEIAAHVDASTPIGFAPQPVVNDINGDRQSDILWRNTNGTLAGWLMNGGSIMSSGILTSGGVAAAPGPTWNVAGISDFNGDGNADVLWRNTDGTLVDWSMNGRTIVSSSVLNIGGVAVKPDATWSVVGTGDFDGDMRADILWRKSDGTLVEWNMNGSTVASSGLVTSSGGLAVKLDATWSVAGIGDFNGDDKRDVLWRNTDGTLVEWNMHGSTVTSSGLVAAGAAKPDASWSVAGIGDFNADGNSDILWRNTNGTLAEWFLNGTNLIGSNAITSGGVAVAPDATWHVVEIGDFNGDGKSDILWRNDNGAVAEWLLNGSAIMQSVTPNLGGTAVSPGATWSTQAKPTNFG